MPLHLLGKKSWNVYSKDNIDRVRRDVAAATLREEEEDRRKDEYDAERRLAILRGQKPPSPPPKPEQATSRSRKRDDEGCQSSDRRKRRRLAGEDDTDREIRLAKEDADTASSASMTIAKVRSKTGDPPLHDIHGHISLFPVDARATHKADKNDEAEAEKKRKDREYEDQYTMRFSNAAGRNAPKKPWYTTSTHKSAGSASNVATPDNSLVTGNKDVWGRTDPRLKEREQARIVTNDPLAFMKKAQRQLKQSEVDRQSWKDERDRETRQLDRLHNDERRRGRLQHRRENDDLENFRLDAPSPRVEQQCDGHGGMSRVRSRRDRSGQDRGHIRTSH